MNDRPRAGRPPNRRDRTGPVRLVPPLAEADPPTTFALPDPDSPTYDSDLLALVGHARTEVRRRARLATEHAAEASRHATQAAQQASMVADICEMADALDSVVTS